jgi:hypothetical protein
MLRIRFGVSLRETSTTSAGAFYPTIRTIESFVSHLSVIDEIVSINLFRSPLGSWRIFAEGWNSPKAFLVKPKKIN